MIKLKKILSGIGSGIAILSILFVPALAVISYPTESKQLLDYIFWILELFLSLCYSYYIWNVINDFIDLSELDYFDRNKIEIEYEKLKNKRKSTTK